MTASGPRHVPSHPHSTLDLPFETAAARIAALHRESRDRGLRGESSSRPLLRTREWIGRAFIAIGSAIAPSAVVRS